MIKRTSRNFKVPLVTGGQWKDHQSFQKWDPISKRLITVNCCLPAKCYEPNPVTNVTLTSMVSGSAVVSWTYDGPTADFEVNIYEGATDNVDTSGTPIYSVLGATSGSTIYFSNTANKYYVASVRVRNECLFSSYTYSSAVQYLFIGYQFIVNSDANISGIVNINVYSFPSVYININKFDKFGTNVDSWLTSTVASSTFIKIQKDVGNYIIANINPYTIDYGTYMQFDCTIISGPGSLNNGDTVLITVG